MHFIFSNKVDLSQERSILIQRKKLHLNRVKAAHRTLMKLTTEENAAMSIFKSNGWRYSLSGSL